MNVYVNENTYIYIYIYIYSHIIYKVVIVDRNLEI